MTGNEVHTSAGGAQDVGAGRDAAAAAAEEHHGVSSRPRQGVRQVQVHLDPQHHPGAAMRSTQHNLPTALLSLFQSVPTGLQKRCWHAAMSAHSVVEVAWNGRPIAHRSHHQKRSKTSLLWARGRVKWTRRRCTAVCSISGRRSWPISSTGAPPASRCRPPAVAYRNASSAGPFAPDVNTSRSRPVMLVVAMVFITDPFRQLTARVMPSLAVLPREMVLAGRR